MESCFSKQEMLNAQTARVIMLPVFLASIFGSVRGHNANTVFRCERQVISSTTRANLRVQNLKPSNVYSAEWNPGSRSQG